MRGTDGKGSTAERSFDIMDHLPPAVAAAVDRLGYDLLQEHGYQTAGAESSQRILRHLERRMKRQGHVLEYCVRPGQEVGTVLLFFRLSDRSGAELGRSRVMKIVLGQKSEKEA